MILSCDRISKLFEKKLPSHIKKGRFIKEKFYALKDVSFSVNEGETFSIIGANGSGKSTLLKILSGITPPDSGAFSAKGRISALLELGAGFHEELNGIENIYLYGAILGIPRENIKKIIPQIIEFSGIEDFLETPVKHYSSGMLARIAFATAVNIDPDILLIDEILSVGDIEFQSRSLDKIKQFKAGGKTVVIVTHVISIATQLSDRIMWLDKGIVKGIGAPAEISGKYSASSHSNPNSQSLFASIIENNPEQKLLSQSSHIIIKSYNSSGGESIKPKTGDKFVIKLFIKPDSTLPESTIHLVIKKDPGWIISSIDSAKSGFRIPANPKHSAKNNASENIKANGEKDDCALKSSSISGNSGGAKEFTAEIIFEKLLLAKGRYKIYAILTAPDNPEVIYGYTEKPLETEVITDDFKFDFFMIDHPVKWNIEAKD